MIFWNQYYSVFNTSGEKSVRICTFLFSPAGFSIHSCLVSASLSLSAQYFALGDKGAREIIVSAYRSIPIKYLPCGNRKRWRYVASIEVPRRVSVYFGAKRNGIGKEVDEC